MGLVLYYHPLASYCWKVLIALYENDTAFEGLVVDLGDEVSREAFFGIWPIGKFPVLQDRTRDRVVPESSIIIEYLASYHPGPVQLVPAEPGAALEARLADRFFDCHVHDHMQRVVADRLRAEPDRDPIGVAAERKALLTACSVAEQRMSDRIWATGDEFTMGDCAAFPALYYADKIEPFSGRFPNLAAYLKRLSARPSIARVRAEARPYMHFFPFYRPGQED